jgi:hypothetical protein
MAISLPDPGIVRIPAKRPPVRPTSLAELVAALEDRARALQCAHDTRHAFTSVLAHHANIVQLMRDADAFGPASAWIERLLLIHAGHYLRALGAWDAADLSTTPAPWRALFARARYEELAETELARHATFVHTAYDLPLALARAGFEGTSPVAARDAFDRLPALVVAERRSPLRALPWRRRITGDVALRVQAWDDGIRLLEAEDDTALRAVFTRIETRALLGVAG